MASVIQKLEVVALFDFEGQDAEELTFKEVCVCTRVYTRVSVPHFPSENACTTRVPPVRVHVFVGYICIRQLTWVHLRVRVEH